MMERETILERNGDGFSVDAALMAQLLNVAPSQVQALMRDNEITSICERGEAEHAGQYRLTFFYKGRRARLTVDETGRVMRRSIINYGERPVPRALHKAGTP